MIRKSDIDILIVDDEKPIRKLLTRILENAGYSCQSAESAVSAKAILASQPFDLLLTDLMMPGESGLELIKYAKTYYPRMGRLMITAISSQEVAQKIIDVGVYGYIIKPLSANIVLITIENALRHQALDFHMQACVNEMKEKISRRSKKLDAIMTNINVGILLLDPEMNVLEMNNKMLEYYSAVGDKEGKACFHIIRKPARAEICENCPVTASLKTGKDTELEVRRATNLGDRDFRVISSPILDDNGKVSATIVLYEDITERLNAERDLRQAQKLEAVGQLAAGIAHEINSPVQFVGDNLSFLKEAFGDISKLLHCYEEILQPLVEKKLVPESLLEKLAQEKEQADLEYLAEEVPMTFSQSMEGIKRVDKIVRAMKDFSHPGAEEKTVCDINKIIETTLTVCRNEWKYVAEVETDLSAELPGVPCFPGDISQVFLNIIVNAAHAINDQNHSDNSKGLGKISIKTQFSKDNVEIRIKDTGGGIPEDIQHRIFDPFFTTKERGKGTGQGLAIANRVVVKKHQGNFSFESQQDVGTTFIVQLPRQGE